MELLWTAVLSAVSFVFLFLLAKMIGNRQMSQLSMFDYIVGITIGSIAAELATNLEEPHKPILAMAVYAALALSFALISNKSYRFRRLVQGKEAVLFDNGKFCKSGFKKGRLDINEFLMQARIAGYFTPNELQTALLEPNGKISFLPLATKRPTCPEDIGIFPTQEHCVTIVISDGQISYDGLERAGKDEIWLKRQLSEQKKKLTEVFLAVTDITGTVSFYGYFPE